MNDSHPSFPEHERRMTTPVNVAKLSNGAKASVVSVIALLVANLIGLTSYIVRDHERQTMNEQAFKDHVEWATEFAKDVNEMKLDIRELTVRSEYAASDIQQHRLTEPAAAEVDP